jgi:hypothetical protein
MLMNGIRIILKIAIALVLLAVVLAAGAAAWLRFTYPRVSPADPDLKIEITAERVARGEYLSNHVLDCFGCHGQRDMETFSFPLKEGTLGAGGFRVPREWKLFPGDVTSPNITPAALAEWTDGEILRALTAGVNREGKFLFPMMPYVHYGVLDREDMYSVVAYLRTLTPIEYNTRPTEIDFPLNLILRTVPRDPRFGTRPDPSDEIASGRYLAEAAGCMICHTVVNQKEEPVGTRYIGGRVFDFPFLGGVLRSPNITPDTATGIGLFTRADFIGLFRAKAKRALEQKAPVTPDDPTNTIMPYWAFAGMTDEDLGAIYAYLRTLPPVEHAVTRWTPRE